MTSAIGSAWRTFWHTMTSNDRHASHDSPYRSGRHLPLNRDPLTSVTSAIESRLDLTDPYEDARLKDATSPTKFDSVNDATSPSLPYSPGMRSLSSQVRQSSEQTVSPEIQMQSFHDGAPPPPPVSHSWTKIDRWLENNYEEMFDNLCEGCTQNDINELEVELDCSLPLEFRESLMIHDGQERGGLPTGVLFGCMLLDCEEIVQEWKNWKKVNEEYFGPGPIVHQQLPSKSASSSSVAGPSQQRSSNPLWRQDLIERQDSQPPGAVRKTYAHPSWIPVARDWGGNNLAIDLAPGATGKWGQVIICGRDYDCKYVVARSWAAFLAMVADDFCSGKVHIEDDSEMKLKLFTKQNVEPPYLEILRWRTDQRYGRRPLRRKGSAGLGLNTQPNNATNRGSPYGSPSEDRGRSPYRFSNRVSNQSPKTQFGASSPLARVTEEVSSPTKASSDTNLPTESLRGNGNEQSTEDLIQVVTPRVPSASEEDTTQDEPKSSDDVNSKELQRAQTVQPPSRALNPKVLDEMKTVAI